MLGPRGRQRSPPNLVLREGLIAGAPGIGRSAGFADGGGVVEKIAVGGVVDVTGAFGSEPPDFLLPDEMMILNFL